jgi:hypothetical protein
MGGLSGGAAGYFNPGATDGVTNQAFSGTEFRPEAYADAQNISNMENIVTADAGMTNIDAAPPQTFTDAGTTGGVGERLSNTRVDGMGADLPNAMTMQGSNANVAGTTTTGVNTTGVNTAGVNTTGNMVRVDSPFGPTPRPTYNQMLDAGYSPTQLKDFAGAPSVLSQTGTEIARRFTDPKALADVSIQAGLQLIGAEIMGVGDMSDEEKEVLRLQKEQMEQLKARDKEAYDFAMKQANELYAMGQRFDPEQLARQYYGRASQKAGLAKRDALRNINPSNTALRAAEERRFNLGAAANTGSAYDRGMITGLNQQANYLNKSAAAFPTQGGNYSAALTGLNQTYANLARKKSAAQQGFNQMFGAFGVSGGDGNDQYRAGLRDGLFGTRNTFKFS